MAALNVRLAASSVLECVVAAILLLICFGITMETLTRITLQGNDPGEYLTVELAIKQTFREYECGTFANGKYHREYAWGAIAVVLSDYSAGIQRLTLTAFPMKGIKAVKYDYLIKRKQ